MFCEIAPNVRERLFAEIVQSSLGGDEFISWISKGIRTLDARRYMDFAEHLGSSRELAEDSRGCPPGVAELSGKKSNWSV